MNDCPSPPRLRAGAAIFTGRLRLDFERRLGKFTRQCAVACTFLVQRLALRFGACGQLSSRSRGLRAQDLATERSSRPLLALFLTYRNCTTCVSISG